MLLAYKVGARDAVVQGPRANRRKSEGFFRPQRGPDLRIEAFFPKLRLGLRPGARVAGSVENGSQTVHRS